MALRSSRYHLPFPRRRTLKHDFFIYHVKLGFRYVGITDPPTPRLYGGP